MTNFLKDLLSGFGGAPPVEPSAAGQSHDSICVFADQTLEYVVDAVSARLRAIGRYKRALREPLAVTLRHIDEMVERVPGKLLCCRSSFVTDPRVNAFFASPQHLQEVFSRSEEVRGLFAAERTAKECWALLCVRKEERKRLGMALVGDAVQKEVAQTAVNFSGHQVVSPGACEADAKRALKCCIFKGLLEHVRRTASNARMRTSELRSRLRTLRGRLSDVHRRPHAEGTVDALVGEIALLEKELATQDPRLTTIDDHLDLVAQMLANPSEFLSATPCVMRLSRFGIKIEEGSDEPGYSLDLSEIRVASREPRIGALVRFPRAELLPRGNFLRKADLFLSM
jgi:hypothetical protein